MCVGQTYVPERKVLKYEFRSKVKYANGYAHYLDRTVLKDVPNRLKKVNRKLQILCVNN